jgi:hypothetical protein
MDALATKRQDMARGKATETWQTGFLDMPLAACPAVEAHSNLGDYHRIELSHGSSSAPS